MIDLESNLKHLGWQPAFDQQVSPTEREKYFIGRIAAVHRTHYCIQFPSLYFNSQGEKEAASFTEKLVSNSLFSSLLAQSNDSVAIGDWVLFHPDPLRPTRILERSTVLSRKAAGRESKIQLIAANVDFLFVVSSCNHDFNLSRIERYLAIANESGCQPIIILTKSDLVEDEHEYRQQIHRLDSALIVESIDARKKEDAAVLSYWCRPGKTIALVGSSGVGKSTLANTLIGSSDNHHPLPTGTIREDDSKGKHTTTSRSLHILADGGILIDNPGIRELQLADCEDGIQEVFDDVLQFVDSCRFRNCNHQTDIGCAALEAVKQGQLDGRRLRNYLKLIAEQKRNSESVADRHRRDKKLGKFYKSVQSQNRKNKSNQ